VLGNAAIDLLLELETVPRPGQSVSAPGKRRDFGGKGLNQAIAVCRRPSPCGAGSPPPRFR